MQRYDDNAVLDFLKRAETPVPAKTVRTRDRRMQFLADWQGPNGGSGRFGSRGFEAGKFDRATEEWNPGTIGPNRLHQMDARVMRERARDLAINNPYAAAAIDAYISNVVETGITPKAQFDDEDRRKLWSRQWEIWGGLTPVSDTQADLTGHDSIYALQALWLKEIIEAGGCLLHFVELPRSRSNGRNLPLAIELIAEERFADERDNFAPVTPSNSKTANPIVRGIELDPATGRPLAYWIRPAMPNDMYGGPLVPTRIPADQCSYGFFRRRIGQQRGHTLLHASIMFLWQLGFYLGSEMLASQMKSQWAYMVKTSEDSDFDFPTLNDDDPDSGVTDIYGNQIDKLEPGMIWRGQKGDDISPVGPNVPQADSLPWIQLIERSIAAGMYLSESELTRDYSRSNFSNTRAAANADRKRFRKMQQFAVAKFCNPTWFRFTQAAARFGIDGFPSQSEFMANLEDWVDVTWRTPGWASVNPKDDMAANEIAVRLRIKTREQIIASEGGDWEDTFEQSAIEERKLEDLDITSPLAPPPKSDPNAQADETNDQPPAAPPKTKSRAASLAVSRVTAGPPDEDDEEDDDL